jgi:lipopolysaccharide export system protein LptA
VKSAESRLNCDILELQFTGESVTPDGSKGAKEAAKNPSPFYGAQGPGEVERIIAKGNVTFKDELSQGAGDNMVWEADRRVATLKGRPATATQDKNTVTAEALVFSQEQKSLSVPCKGDLVFWTKGEVGLMPAGTTSPKQPKTDVPTPMRVTWNKDMSYTASKAVFNDRVRAEQGQNWLTSEVLEVSFDDQNRLKGALATGPVTIRHEGRQAFGNRLEWSADAGEAWLTGEPRAEVREGESFIGCPKLGFLRDKDRIEAVGSGYLVAVPKPGPPQPGRPPATPLPGQDPNAKIRVTWAERMDFNLGRHTATFHKDVHAGREDLKIAANEMQVVFDDSNQKISKLVADDPKGDLRLEHPQGTGRGTHAEWNALDETAGIFGEPRAVVMMEAGRRLEAPKIFANTQTQAVHTEGGGVFTSPQKSDEKQAKTQAMALNDEANVEWSDTLDFDKAAQEAIFKGNVRARAGDKSIASDVLRLDFSGTDKKMELKRVLAEGHVALSQTSQQGAGERFAWDAGSDEATLEGNPARAGGEAQGYEVAGPVIKILRINQPKQDILVNGKGTLTFAKPLQGGTGKGDQVTITWNDKFIFERSAGKGVFTGGATVSQGARKVRSDRIEVLLDQQEQIEVVRAIDNVAVEDTQEYQEATGASLDWFKSDDKAVLTGAPDATIWFGSRDGSARTRTQAQRIVFLGFFFDERKEGEQAKRGRKVTFEGPVSFNASGE